jgi:metal-responsive CopG/Arc/MetJ family transcriptional regulator
MPSIKTAISVEEPLFQEMEALAKELAVSRSQVFALAARDFVQQHKAHRLLAAINAAYTEPDTEETAVMERMREEERKLVQGQW